MVYPLPWTGGIAASVARIKAFFSFELYWGFDVNKKFIFNDASSNIVEIVVVRI